MKFNDGDELLVIETSRDGYSPEQLHGTMTVGELRELLENYDDDMPVILSNDNGYTYGGLSEFSFKCQRIRKGENGDWDGLEDL